MADPPPATPAPDRGATASTPRWVKVFAIIMAVLALLLIIGLFTGGGRHGPGRHTASGDTGGQAPSSSVTEDDTPLEGGRA